MSDAYKNTEKLGEAFKVDSFELYLINEIDKLDDKMYKYTDLQTRKNTLKEIREKYYSLNK